jgi:hypothetical protein
VLLHLMAIPSPLDPNDSEQDQRHDTNRRQNQSHLGSSSILQIADYAQAGKDSSNLLAGSIGLSPGSAMRDLNPNQENLEGSNIG